MKDETSIKRAVELMNQLDAAGWAVVFLRCDRVSDIRRVVAGYKHSAGRKYIACNGNRDHCGANMREATAFGTVKEFFEPFNFFAHGSTTSSRGDGTIHGYDTSLMNWFREGVESSSDGMKNRLLYVPNATDIFGDSERPGSRSPDQLQYLYCLRELAEKKRAGDSKSFVVIGCTDGRLYRDLLEYGYVVDVGCPEQADLKEIIREACIESGGTTCGLTNAVVNGLVEVVRGMRREDVRNVINLAYAQNPAPLAGDAEWLYAVALDAKRQRIAGIAGLKWIDVTDEEIGGLDELRNWLGKRGDAFNYIRAAARCLVTPPKGVLVVGLPGSGKTALGRCASKLLGGKNVNRVPLLQMDLSAMLSKWYGEAEHNFQQAIHTVDDVAPCILLVDEIEKLFDKDEDGGNPAGRRIFAALLDWLQEEKSKPVLVVATANKVQALPPELKRKGRLDEVFFTGIPTREECRKIMQIRLKRRSKIFDREMCTENGIGRVVDAFLDAAAKERRFLIGADIETIVGIAIGNLFADIDSDTKQAIQDGKRNPDKYSSDEICKALLSELKATRTFFDNNMEETVKFWLEMNRLNLRNAGGPLVLDGKRDGYDESCGRFTSSDLGLPHDDANYESVAESKADSFAKAGDYDRALKYVLAAEIFRFVQRETRSRT